MHLSLQDGDTPLMVASREGRYRCVQLLLDRGAQVNHQNKVSEFWDQPSVMFPCVKRAYSSVSDLCGECWVCGTLSSCRDMCMLI